MEQSYAGHHWISEDGLELYYRDYKGPEGDQGPPVVCLHGLTRNSRDFDGLAHHLSQTRRVLVPEMRGRGASEYAIDPKTYNVGQYTADLAKLLGDLEVDRFICVGTSMGGLITMIFAASHPGRLAGVVMNDIGPEINPAGVERIAGYVGQGRNYPSWIHAARALSDLHGDAFPDYDLEQWLDMAKRVMAIGQNGRISFDYDITIADTFNPPSAAAPAHLWLDFENLRDVPMVLVRGAMSDVLAIDTAKQMAVRNPALTRVTIEGVGHAPTLDEPQARAAIDALLAQI